MLGEGGELCECSWLYVAAVLAHVAQQTVPSGAERSISPPRVPDPGVALLPLQPPLEGVSHDPPGRVELRYEAIGGVRWALDGLMGHRPRISNIRRLAHPLIERGVEILVGLIAAYDGIGGCSHAASTHCLLTPWFACVRLLVLANLSSCFSASSLALTSQGSLVRSQSRPPFFSRPYDAARVSHGLFRAASRRGIKAGGHIRLAASCRTI